MFRSAPHRAPQKLWSPAITPKRRGTETRAGFESVIATTAHLSAFDPAVSAGAADCCPRATDLEARDFAICGEPGPHGLDLW